MDESLVRPFHEPTKITAAAAMYKNEEE